MRAAVYLALAILAVQKVDALCLDGISRRSAVMGFTALAPAVLAPHIASAETCLGKCPEDPEKAAARRALQNGSQAKAMPATFAELVAKTIEQKENTLGMSLSEAEKKQVEERVRKAYPGVY